MAKRVKTIVLITDDLSGEELPEGEGTTIAYTWEGAEYVIDLSEDNAKKFEEAIEPFLKASRKSRSLNSPRRNRAQMQEVREWGRKNGFTVPDGRGRTPQALLQAYNDAHKIDK